MGQAAVNVMHSIFCLLPEPLWCKGGSQRRSVAGAVYGPLALQMGRRQLWNSQMCFCQQTGAKPPCAHAQPVWSPAGMHPRRRSGALLDKLGCPELLTASWQMLARCKGSTNVRAHANIPREVSGYAL